MFFPPAACTCICLLMKTKAIVTYSDGNCSCWLSSVLFSERMDEETCGWQGRVNGGEGSGSKDTEQTAQLSRRGAMSCESEGEKKEMSARYEEKRPACGGLFET